MKTNFDETTKSSNEARRVLADGYIFCSDGRVFKGDKEVTYYKSKSRGKTYLRVRLNGKRFYLASLICELFNGKTERNLIFKDRNTLNVNANNLMFVNDKAYCIYSKWQNVDQGRPKIKYCQTKAVLMCKCNYLREYYKTLNIEFIYKSWDKIKFCFPEIIRDDLFDYFLDRALRNSIIGNPKGLMMMYKKGLMFKIEYNDGIKRNCISNFN